MWGKKLKKFASGLSWGATFYHLLHYLIRYICNMSSKPYARRYQDESFLSISILMFFSLLPFFSFEAGLVEEKFRGFKSNHGIKQIFSSSNLYNYNVCFYGTKVERLKSIITTQKLLIDNCQLIDYSKGKNVLPDYNKKKRLRHKKHHFISFNWT